jgi:hypothetical protein
MSPYSRKKYQSSSLGKISFSGDQDEDEEAFLKLKQVEDDPGPIEFQVIRKHHSLNLDEKLIL